jgi:hypothetical protein
MSELSFFLESGNIIYTVTTTILLIIIGSEIIALLAGVELVGLLNGLLDIDFRVYIDVVTLFLFGYSLGGYVVHYFLFITPWWMSWLIGFPFGVACIKIFDIPITRFDDGTAPTIEDYIGQIAVLTLGNAVKEGLLAEAKLDLGDLGIHYIQVKLDPSCTVDIVKQGDKVVILSQYVEGCFYVFNLTEGV